MLKSPARRGALAAAITAGLLLGLLVASQAQASTVYACVKKNGNAHIYSKKPKCKKGESKVSWNNVGPAGKNGTNGANGTSGTSGAAGKEGVTGLNGTAVAYAEVNSAGVLGGNSKGIAKMSPGGSPAEGTYCMVFEHPESIHLGVATTNLFGGGTQPSLVGVDLAPIIEVLFGSCATGTNVAIHTYTLKGEATPAGFFAIFD